jgi:Recombination endonuclease VII
MKKLCSVGGCKNKAVSRTWCITHYSRWLKHGDVQADIPVRAIGQRATCCDAKHYANGLCANHYMQQWHRDHPEEMAARELRRCARRIGLDPRVIEEHFKNHPGVCDACGRTTTDTSRRCYRLSIDHDHDTGKFRGVICSPCNRAIGFADDDPARLRALADYLDRANE